MKDIIWFLIYTIGGFIFIGWSANLFDNVTLGLSYTVIITYLYVVGAFRILSTL
jgi:hypothetical protein